MASTGPDAYHEEEDRVGGETVLEDMLIECGVRPDLDRRGRGEEEEERGPLTGAEEREMRAHLRMAARGEAEREEIDGEAGGRDEDAMEAYRRRRLAQLKAAARAARFGRVADVEAPDFEREVREASAEACVVLLLVLRAHAPSENMSGIVDELARRHPAVKFCRMQASAAVRNFPPEDAPAVMAYRESRVVAQFARLDGFAGAATDADVVEWDLAAAGVLQSEQTEDPRSRPGFGRMRVHRPGAARRAPESSSDEDDSDW